MQEIVDLVGNSSELARRANVSRTAVEKWRKGMSEPSRDNLIALANAANVSVLWIVTGQGEMLSSSKPDSGRRARTGFEEPGPSRPYGDAQDGEKTKPAPPGLQSGRKAGAAKRPQPPLMQNVTTNNPDFVYIPCLNAAFSANAFISPENEVSENYLALRKDWARRTLQLDPTDLALINAPGDSMEPTIRSGDTLLVNTAATQFNNDGIYVLEQNGAMFIKRVQVLFDKSVTIKSDNPAYSEQTLSKQDALSIHIVGIVCWIGRPC